VKLLTCLWLAGSLQASVIFSDLSTDPLHVYDSFDIAAVDNFNWLAAPFLTAPGSWVFGGLDIALREDLGGSFAASAAILSDAGGAPGAVLGTFTLTGLPGFDHRVIYCCDLYQYRGGPAVLLSGDTRYWLAIRPVGPTAIDAWWDNGLGITGTSFDLAVLGGAGAETGNRLLPAFDIVGAPVPEVSPAAAVVVFSLVGVVVLWCRRWT